ncbi:MAG: 2-dehydropantoate 2-reductase [Candidatus Lokiarchaeota archaeon]
MPKAKIKKIKIGFIGAGSIGSLFGGYLASLKSQEYEIEVILFSREPHVRAIREKGLTLEKPNSNIVLQNIKAYSSLEEFQKDYTKSYRFDFLFITTKVYDSEKALKEYSDLVSKCRSIVILQNGIGNEEIVEKHSEREKIVRVITTLGALLKVPGYVVHTGVGFIKIGCPFPVNSIQKDKEKEWREKSLQLLSKFFNSVGLECHIVNDILKECWEKVFVNVGINPFAGITRLRNGQLLEDGSLKALMKDAVEEAIKVAKAKRIMLNRPNSDYIELMYDVARKTYRNQNSMLQDILREKKTEIDFINGKIVDYARDLGIAVPINQTLTSLIKGIEQSYSDS